MPVTATTSLPDASSPTLSNGIEDEIELAWSHVTDYGSYRAQFKETSDGDWLTALSHRSGIDPADATTDWGTGGGPNAGSPTLSTAATPSEDGMSIELVHSGDGDVDYLFYNPTSAFALQDTLQFWYYTDGNASHVIRASDGTNTATVDFSTDIDTGQGNLVQVDASEFTGVDTSSVADLRWSVDDGTTIYVDSLLTGDKTLGEHLTVAPADATTDWASGSNATLSTTAYKSLDGTAVRADTDSAATQGSRTATYDPTGTWDISGYEVLQFRYWTDQTAGTHALTFSDGTNTETVDFSGQVSATADTISIDLTALSTPDMTAITRLQWDFAGDGSGIDKAVIVDQVTAWHSDVVIPNLEDGEEYEVRLRTETEHVTGAWTSPVSIITTFPTPDNATAGTPTQTTVDLSWNEYADNEDGFRVWRAREYDSGWGPWREVADLAPNATTHTDDTASPGNTYKYYIEAYTEHTTSESGETTAVSTDSSGRPRIQTDAQGWTVHVHHPNADAPIEPQLLDDPNFTPALNDYPRVEIPVPKSETWQASAFEDAPLSVWKDGRIRPIDELVNVRMEDDRTVLEGRGGRELDDRVTDEFDNVEAHVAAEQLGTNNTSYVMNVDDPASTTRSDTVMQSGDTDTELRDALASPIAEDDPVKITSDGRLALEQTCFFREGENPTRSQDSSSVSYDDSSNGARQRLSLTGAYVEYDFNIDHTIPASEVGAAFRETAENDPPAMEWHVNGNRIDYLTASTTGLGGLDWELKGDGRGDGGDNYNGDGYTGPDLHPNDNPHTIRIKVTDGEGSNLVFYDVDCVALYDQRHPRDWPETLTSDGYLPGPKLYPTLERGFAEVPSAFNVTAGQIDVTMDDTSGEQALYLSNDGGTSWAGPGQNTSSFQADFTDPGTSIRWKARLGPYGSQNATPTQGIYGQSLDAFTLSADLEDTPVLDAQKYDGQLKAVFNQIAEYGNFIWSLERDQQGWRVEWTQPGQRQADVDDDLADYRVDKSTEQRYEKAVIKGGNQPVQGEEFTAQHDTWVALNQSELVSGTEIVRDPSTGERFEFGTDYELDRSEGRIKALSGGSMSDGSVYEIDYEFKPTGSYTAADAGSNPDEVVRTRPELASNRACEQAALYLIQRVQEPQWSAEVTVPDVGAGVSLVDDLAWAGLPTSGVRMEVQDLEQSPQQTVMHLGNWESPSAVLDDFASRISANSERS